MSKPRIILAIESSCDETSAAVYDLHSRQLVQETYSQVDLHRIYGGVVPELASRSHLEKLYSVVNSALAKADVSLSMVDAVAYTRGPGLVGPLLIGSTYADALAFALGVPLIPVHHLEAHITVAMHELPALQFPFLALLVSGGHTELIYAKSLGSYEVLGETMDDAAGEAFDKCGKVMGLAYPAGPEIAKLADDYDASFGVPVLPEPLKGKSTLNFSFSGLKSAFARSWQNRSAKYSQPAYAYAIQSAIVASLLKRIKQVWPVYDDCPLVVAGGVAANQCLRRAVAQEADKRNAKVYVPSLDYCTDNAGMIAHNAALRIAQMGFPTVPDQKVQPRWLLGSLSIVSADDQLRDG